MIKQVYFAILTMIVMAIVVYLLHEKILATWQSANKDTIASQSIDDKLKRLMVSPHFGIPKQIDFCGEAVPLSEIEVIERLDFELLVNSYMHANTILILKKAKRWFPQIEPILKAQGIPDDFKYLAVIESGLDNAVSPSGASGFWQLMPETAKDYGLVITEEVDERFHPIKSTQVACQYLKESYQKFNNWTLVAAAYNAGNGTIQKAIDTQKVGSYYDLLLSKQANRFVFRILALKEIMQNPEKYRFDVQDKDGYLPEMLRTIQVKKTISNLVDFSIDQKVSYKTLKSYNEWILTDRLTVKDTSASWVIQLPSQ
jgi:hypothetical protein